MTAAFEQGHGPLPRRGQDAVRQICAINCSGQLQRADPRRKHRDRSALAIRELGIELIGKLAHHG